MISSNQSEQYDCVVIGGGTAGVFAAICAAKCGSKTLLIEKNGMLGGTMTIGGVNFPGLFHAWGKQIIDGPCYEAIKRCHEKSNTPLPKFEYDPKYHPDNQIEIDPFFFACTLDQMCEESSVHILFHTMLADAKQNENGLELLICCKEGLRTIFTQTAIDATGDASLCQMLNYELEISDEIQPATLINNLSGYDYDAINHEAFIQYMDEKLKKTELNFHNNNMLSSLRRHRISGHTCGINSKTSEEKTQLEIKARKELEEVIRILRSFKGLENLYVSYCATETAVRESVRIHAKYNITAEDYQTGKLFSDAVSYAFYPIDLHTASGVTPQKLSPEIIPTIPYRSLIPIRSKNVLVAGRIIGSTQEANSALRVQATCMSCGQVAGTACSIAAQKKLEVGDVDYFELTTHLKRIGAIIPHQ